MSITRVIWMGVLCAQVCACSSSQAQAPNSRPGAVTELNCSSQTLSGVDRVICSSEDLRRRQKMAVDLNDQLSGSMKGRNLEMLRDYERLFQLQRNQCANDRAGIQSCVERVIESRQIVLKKALAEPDSIHETFIAFDTFDVETFAKYGDLVTGKSVSVYGCMTLLPSASPESRTVGSIKASCGNSETRAVPAVFKSMTVSKAIFFDTREPSSYWRGTAERYQGRIALTKIDP